MSDKSQSGNPINAVAAQITASQIPTQAAQGMSQVAASSGMLSSAVKQSRPVFVPDAEPFMREPYEPVPTVSLRVFNPEGNIEMELTLDKPTEEQVDAIIEVFRNTRRMQ